MGNLSSKLTYANVLTLLIITYLVTTNMAFEQYITLGKNLGLDGKDLVEFAREREQVDLAKAREKAERDERAVDRAYQKDLRELELKLEQ